MDRQQVVNRLLCTVERLETGDLEVLDTIGRDLLSLRRQAGDGLLWDLELVSRPVRVVDRILADAVASGEELSGGERR